MKVYTCEDRLTDIMTCIYDAWSEALQIGHNQIQLKKEPVRRTQRTGPLIIQSHIQKMVIYMIIYQTAYRCYRNRFPTFPAC